MLVNKANSSERRTLLAVVAEDVAHREALTAAFTGDGVHRVIVSAPIDRAASAIDGQKIDAIIGFVEDAGAWVRFRELAEQFSEHLSILLVTDPDEVGAVADGEALNTVVGLAKEQLATEAPTIAAKTAREFGVRGTPLAQAGPIDRDRLESLSGREREILALTAQGMSIKEIASDISRAYATVAKHRANIMDKLGLHDKVALTRFAIRTGLIDA